MQQLSQQITNLLCPKHDEAYSFICIEEVCKHDQRIMCGQCVNLGDTDDLVHIKKTCGSIANKLVKYETDINQYRSNLWQRFMRMKVQLMEQLKQLEYQMETYINHNISNMRSKMQFIDIDLNLMDIETIGSLLSEQIILENEGHKQYNIKHLIEYIQSDNIMCQFEQTMNVLNAELSTISDRIIEEEQQQITTLEDINNIKYHTSQTIQLDGCCAWICLNHDETQIAAAIEASIIILNLSDKGLWIKGNTTLIGPLNFIWQVKFNHNSTQIASCSEDKLIMIWNKLPNGKWSIQDKISNHKDFVCSVSFNHDSTILVSGSVDKTIHIHYPKDGKWRIQQQLNDASYVYDVCFNHNSTLLASGGKDNSIVLWEYIGHWQLKQKLTGHTNRVSRVYFNANSTLLVSGSFDKTIKIWQSNNQQVWKCIHTLIGHTNTIRSVRFNHESNMIISSSDDKSIRIWRINQNRNWECIQTINKHTGSVSCAIITNDSQTIISASSDKKLLIHKQQTIIQE